MTDTMYLPELRLPTLNDSLAELTENGRNGLIMTSHGNFGSALNYPISRILCDVTVKRGRAAKTQIMQVLCIILELYIYYYIFFFEK